MYRQFRASGTRVPNRRHSEVISEAASWMAVAGSSVRACSSIREKNSSESVVPSGVRPPRERISSRRPSERSNWPLWANTASPSRKGWVLVICRGRPGLALRRCTSIMGPWAAAIASR